MQAKIFDPFFTTKEVGKGTGLGLAIVNKIVEEHGGEMTFAPAPDGGTSVTMTFACEPLADRSKPEAAE